MTSGRDALRTLDAALVDARRALTDAYAAAAARAERLGEVERRQAQAYAKLAEFRLDLIKTDAIAARLGEADRTAAGLLARHRDAVSFLETRERETEARIVDLEARRQAEEAEVDAARADADRAIDATRERLRLDPGFSAAVQALADAEGVAARAAQKLDVARTDRDEKGEPYDADPLFSYLWRRGWATPAYRGGGLFRLLDAWVAGLVKYEAARLNYARLTELPERLAEHVGRVEARVEAARADVEALERAARQADGTAAIEAAAEAAAAKLAATDAEIDKAEAAHAEAAAALADALKGEGGPYAQARAVLAEALSERDVPDLRVLAAETESPDDDRLVDEVVRLRAARLELDVQTDDARTLPDRYRRFLEDLEAVRSRFKRAGLDAPEVEFPAGDLVRLLLEQFRRGALSRDGLWRKLEGAHRRRRRSVDEGGWGGHVWDQSPDIGDIFGGGGWPRSGRSGGGGFRPPRSSGGVRPPRVPRSMGRPGGFKTGGGF